MPYHMEKQGNQYCVINENTGKSVGCHPTMQEAKDHMAALYANVKDAKSQLENVPSRFHVEPRKKV